MDRSLPQALPAMREIPGGQAPFSGRFSAGVPEETVHVEFASVSFVRGKGSFGLPVDIRRCFIRGGSPVSHYISVRSRYIPVRRHGHRLLRVYKCGTRNDTGNSCRVIRVAKRCSRICPERAPATREIAGTFWRAIRCGAPVAGAFARTSGAAHEGWSSPLRPPVKADDSCLVFVATVG